MARALIICFIDDWNPWVEGEVHNEGDIEKLLTHHLDHFGDQHRPYTTLIVEGSPTWQQLEEMGARLDRPEGSTTLGWSMQGIRSASGQDASGQDLIAVLQDQPNPYPIREHSDVP